MLFNIQEALSCVDQPVLTYLLKFKNRMEIYVIFYTNETDLVLLHHTIYVCVSVIVLIIGLWYKLNLC